MKIEDTEIIEFLKERLPLLAIPERRLFAAMAMQGLLALPYDDKHRFPITDAVICADALIKELDKK